MAWRSCVARSAARSRCRAVAGTAPKRRRVLVSGVVAGRGGVGREAADADGERVGAPAPGGAPVAGLDPAVEALLLVVGPRQVGHVVAVGEAIPEPAEDDAEVRDRRAQPVGDPPGAERGVDRKSVV